MSFPGMTSTVSVAPREIRDLVYRIARVEGADAGVADLIAERVLATEITVGGAVTQFVAGQLATQSVAPTASVALDDDQLRRAFESGLAIDTATFEELERLAAQFLVAEAVLDALL